MIGAPIGVHAPVPRARISLVSNVGRIGPIGRVLGRRIPRVAAGLVGIERSSGVSRVASWRVLGAALGKDIGIRGRILGAVERAGFIPRKSVIDTE
jgi:hypothetical protein